MAKDIFFLHALTIGLGPGRAVKVNAGEVLVGVDGEVAATLLKRAGARIATDEDRGVAKLVTMKERELEPGLAALISPPLDPRRVEASDKAKAEANERRERELRLAALEQRAGGRA